MIIDDYMPATVLTGFVREVPYPANLRLNQYLPDRYVGDIEAAMDQVERTNRAAQFRAWDSETPLSRRDQFTRSRVKLPPLGVKLPIGEYERLMLERARTGGDNRDAYVEAIYNDAEQLTREVYNRMELARGDALTDGVFRIAYENGLKGLEADFGLPSTHLVAAATPWSNTASAVPLTNMDTWMELYQDDNNGDLPGVALTSRKVVSNLRQSAQIRALYYRGDTVSGGPDILTPAQLNTVLTSYGYPPFVVYDTKLETAAGATTRVIPEDRILFLPSDPSSLGFTAWGVTAESLELAGGQNPGLLFSDLSGLVGVVLKEGDPLRVWTKVGAVGMPILSNPKRLVVATVL